MKTSFKEIKIILCVLFTLFAGFLNFIAVVCMLALPKFDLKLILFIPCLILTVVLLWIVILRKTKVYLRFLFCAMFGLSIFQIPSVFYTFTLVNMCVDIGLCAEGLKTGIDGERVEINKENCLKYGLQWHEEDRMCNTRKQAP